MRTIFVSLTLVISCSVFAVDAASRVINGTQVPATAYPTVAQITDPNNPFYRGTGTLISPTHILTAAHVITDGAGNLNLTTANQVYVNGALYNIALSAKHPSYVPGAGETENQFDVGIITLTTPVAGTSFTPINRSTPQVGDLLTLVGYGAEGTGTTGSVDVGTPNGIVDYGTTPIGLVTTTFIKWNFALTTQASTAPGDSGGPAFVVKNGVAYLAGSTVGGRNSGIGAGGTGYGNICFDVRTDQVSDFVDSVVGFTDLTTAQVSLPDPGMLTVGQPFSTVCPVANNGGVQTPPFNVRFHLSPDGVYRESDPLLGTVRFPSGLNPHSQSTSTFTFTVPNVIGQYYVAYMVDADNEVFESDKSNNKFFNPSIATVAVNHPPSITSGPFVTFNPVFTGFPIVFSVAATDPDGDTLGIGWDFGDGTTGTGATPTHVYLAAGTYLVAVAIDDGRGGTDSKTATITVVPEVPATASRQKFALNFRLPGKDTFDITLSNTTFSAATKVTTAGKTLDLFVGGTKIDTVTLLNGRGKSQNGTATFNFRQGSIRYQLRNSNLLPALAPFGIKNATMFGTFSVPVYVRYNATVYYGSAPSFFYSATMNKSGKGS